MKDKKYTFLIVADDRGRPRRLTVSGRLISFVAFLTVAFTTLLFALLVDYLGLMVQSVENKRLTAENRRLRQNFEIVEGKLASLEGSLERVQSFYTKLKMITNVEDRERALKLAIGPLPKPGQSIDGSPFQDRMESRGLAAVSHQEAYDDHGHSHAANESEHSMNVPIDESQNEIKAMERSDFSTIAIRIDRAVAESRMREQNILELWETLSERLSLLSATPSIKPARGWLTSRFGYRNDPFTNRIVMHNGLDIAAAPGSPVYAPADGVISFSGYDEAYGKLVTIDHGYGVMTRFAHNSRLFVTVGQRVKRWDVLSAVGNTGRSTGPHLHYEVRINGVPVDPANYILE